jgi:DNA mismatch endonuclease, patch repair protein
VCRTVVATNVCVNSDAAKPLATAGKGLSTVRKVAKEVAAVRKTSEPRSRIMRAIKSRDTSPELAVRSLAHRLGYRFRVCRRDLPGSPDLVFPRLRKVIFVNGCFWHSHDCGEGVRVPLQNRPYWKQKLRRTKERDEAACEALRALGWKVTVFWECELANREGAIRKLRTFLR